MPATLLAVLLALQMMLCAICPSANITRTPPAAQPVFFGMLDPELSAWFARLPCEGEKQDERILWDWSWQGFLASLLGQPLVKEANGDAVSV